MELDPEKLEDQIMAFFQKHNITSWGLVLMAGDRWLRCSRMSTRDEFSLIHTELHLLLREIETDDLRKHKIENLDGEWPVIN